MLQHPRYIRHDDMEMTTVGSCSCQPGDMSQLFPVLTQIHKYKYINTSTQIHKYSFDNCWLVLPGDRHVPAFPGSNPAMPPLKPNHRTRSPPPPLQYLGAALAHGSRVAARRKARAPSHPTWAHTLVCALKLIHLCAHSNSYTCVQANTYTCVHTNTNT